MSRHHNLMPWQDDNPAPIMPAASHISHSDGDTPSWMRGEGGSMFHEPNTWEPSFSQQSLWGHQPGGHTFSSGDRPAFEGPLQDFGGHGYDPGHDFGQEFGHDMGWGTSAWGEAGGFDAVLVGHLVHDLMGSTAGHDTIVVIPIEHLEINNITQVESTQVVLNAANGGSIQVGGAVNALSSQGLLGFGDDAHGSLASHGPALPQHGGFDPSGSASNEVTLLAGNGDGNHIGGNVTAVADQEVPGHFF